MQHIEHIIGDAVGSGISLHIGPGLPDRREGWSFHQKRSPRGEAGSAWSREGLALLPARNLPTWGWEGDPKSLRVASPGLLVFQMTPPSVLPKSIFFLWSLFGFLQVQQLALLVIWTKLPILFPFSPSCLCKLLLGRLSGLLICLLCQHSLVLLGWARECTV